MDNNECSQILWALVRTFETEVMSFKQWFLSNQPR